MNCDKVQDLISEAIDGALPASQAHPFQDHLAACPSCRMLFADVKDSLALLADMPVIEVSAGFDDAVRARLRSEPRAAGASLADRVARWRETFANPRAVGPGPGIPGAWLRWTPLGAAAALLVWVAMSRDTFGPGTAGEDGAGTSVAVTETSAEFSAPADPAASSSPDLRPVEFAAPMPQVVEVFLESGRELRVSADRYRRSNYHYPLRAVHDPLSGPMVPVSGGVVSERPTAEDPGAQVLTF